MSEIDAKNEDAKYAMDRECKSTEQKDECVKWICGYKWVAQRCSY